MDKTTTKKAVITWLLSHPHKTLSEISEGIDIEPGQLGSVAGEMLRDGELSRTKRRREPFRYEVKV